MAHEEMNELERITRRIQEPLILSSGLTMDDYQQITDLSECACILLAEVERLRAEIAAMREIVESVSGAGPLVVQFSGKFGTPPYCAFPGCDYESRHQHTADCPITKAQALMAQEEK